MNIYIYISWLIFINIFLIKIKNQKISNFLVFIPMFISLATQVNIGTDYHAYRHSFLFIDIYEYEIGYILLNVLLKSVSNNPRILFVTISLIQVFLLYNIIKKMYKRSMITNIPLFILCLCTASSLYYLMFNGLRSSIAILFFNISLLCFFSDKKKLAVFFLVLGGSFHKSIVVITLLIYFFRKLFFRRYCQKLLFVFLSSMALLNIFQAIPKLSIFLYNNISFNFPYKAYLISEHMKQYTFVKGFGIATYIFIFIYIMTAIFYKNYDKNLFFYNLGIFTIGLRLLFNNIPIFYRLIDYLSIMETLIIYSMIIETTKKKWSYLGLLLLVFFLVTKLGGLHKILNFNNTLEKKYYQNEKYYMYK